MLLLHDVLHWENSPAPHGMVGTTKHQNPISHLDLKHESLWKKSHDGTRLTLQKTIQAEGRKAKRDGENAFGTPLTTFGSKWKALARRFMPSLIDTIEKPSAAWHNPSSTPDSCEP
jgi:hypothetical protein